MYHELFLKKFSAFLTALISVWQMWGQLFTESLCDTIYRIFYHTLKYINVTTQSAQWAAGNQRLYYGQDVEMCIFCLTESVGFSEHSSWKSLTRSYTDMVNDAEHQTSTHLMAREKYLLHCDATYFRNDKFSTMLFKYNRI